MSADAGDGAELGAVERPAALDDCRRDMPVGSRLSLRSSQRALRARLIEPVIVVLAGDVLLSTTVPPKVAPPASPWRSSPRRCRRSEHQGEHMAAGETPVIARAPNVASTRSPPPSSSSADREVDLAVLSPPPGAATKTRSQAGASGGTIVRTFVRPARGFRFQSTSRRRAVPRPRPPPFAAAPPCCGS